MILDLKIRQETRNIKSLDDVMRGLYKVYYQLKYRGFTDKEIQQECGKVADVSLTELFSYTTTITNVNYPKYLAYAGLDIDSVNSTLPALTIGAEVRYTPADSALVVREVTWPSAAFTQGLKTGDKIIRINNERASL